MLGINSRVSGDSRQWDSFEEGLRLYSSLRESTEKSGDNPDVFAKLQRLPDDIRVISRLDLHRHGAIVWTWLEVCNAY